MPLQLMSCHLLCCFHKFNHNHYHFGRNHRHSCCNHYNFHHNHYNFHHDIYNSSVIIWYCHNCFLELKFDFFCKPGLQEDVTCKFCELFEKEINKSRNRACNFFLITQSVRWWPRLNRIDGLEEIWNTCWIEIWIDGLREIWNTCRRLNRIGRGGLEERSDCFPIVGWLGTVRGPALGSKPNWFAPDWNTVPCSHSIINRSPPIDPVFDSVVVVFWDQ